MNTTLLARRAGALAFATCATAAQAAGPTYANVGEGPFGSLSWVSRDYHFTSVSHYDGGPLKFLSSQAEGWWLSYADANLNGAASSSLLDGTLHVAAGAGRWGPLAASYSSSYAAGAGTAMWDRIRFGSATGTHVIPLRMRVDGSVAGAAGARVRWHVGPTNPFAEFAKQPFQGWRYLNGNPGGAGVREWDTTFELGSVTVDPVYADWQVNVYFEMEATAYSTRTSGGLADFSHTARLSWDLPEGVSVQSASGRFMTAPLSPVPELPSAAMALLGIALLPALRRRAAARAADPHQP